MGNTEINQHKEMAMGYDIDAGGGCGSAFNGRKIHGGEEVSKKRHLRDEKRGLKHLHKSADHGPHEMNLPRSLDGD